MGSSGKFKVGEIVRVVGYPGQKDPGAVAQITGCRLNRRLDEYFYTLYYFDRAIKYDKELPEMRVTDFGDFVDDKERTAVLKSYVTARQNKEVKRYDAFEEMLDGNAI